MGRSVGNAFITGANIAVDQKCAFITIPSSGGARMQGEYPNFENVRLRAYKSY